MSNPFYVDESKPWFKSENGWPEQVPNNYDFPHMTLYRDARRICGKIPPKSPVMWFLDTFMTFKECHRHVLALANGLSQPRREKGRRGGADFTQFLSICHLLLRLRRMGLVVTGVNPTYKPGEVLHQFRLTGVKSVIVLGLPVRKPSGRTHLSRNYPGRARDNDKHRRSGENVGLKKWLGKTAEEDTHGAAFLKAPPLYRDLTENGAQPAAVQGVCRSDRHTYIMTGGTTGVPKAAVLSHFNCVSNAVQLDLWVFMGGGGLMFSRCPASLPFIRHDNGDEPVRTNGHVDDALPEAASDRRAARDYLSHSPGRQDLLLRRRSAVSAHRGLSGYREISHIQKSSECGIFGRGSVAQAGAGKIRTSHRGHPGGGLWAVGVFSRCLRRAR